MNELLSFYSLWKVNLLKVAFGEEFKVHDLLSYHFTLTSAGNGKTETMKYLAKIFGKLSLVYTEVILKFEIHISIFFRYIIINIPICSIIASFFLEIIII